MVENISDAEVRAVRWVEHILAPLIVISIVTLGTCANQTTEAVAQVEAKQVQSDRYHNETKAEIRSVKNKQDIILKQQHEIDVNVKKIETTQGHFNKQIDDLKDQNTEILKILRNGG
jgi:septal ring factor EnvC (AmiA/AmiB activator)